VSEVIIRRARTADIPAVHDLIEPLSVERVLLAKARVTLYEGVQEFWVAEDASGLIGCGALHVLWDDLAEVRTLAVSEAHHGAGVGSRLLERLVQAAVELGVQRVFCLTFAVEFFARHGFAEIDGVPVEPAVYAQLLQSYDEGVAEFLDLERVKPNTLGNTRMLLRLDADSA
jgi:amino-acid N-acetyltransferase